MVPAATLIHELREPLIATATATISTRVIGRNLFAPLTANNGANRKGKKVEKRKPYSFGVSNLVTLS
jgi:hypothetical protein